MSILVIDVGTTSLRVGELSEQGELVSVIRKPAPLSIPGPGLVELDAQELYEQVRYAATEICQNAQQAGRQIEAVGIANQRATAVVWERASSDPIAPALSWNDLRTLDRCLSLKADGWDLAPNESATKIVHLLEQRAQGGSGQGGLCAGTLDSWLIWRLSQGECFVTDRSNAGLSGLLRSDATGWNTELLEHLSLDPQLLPDLTDTVGVIGQATDLPDAPPIAALVGDQQSSLTGQGCTLAGLGKATFGTGAAVDICLGDNRVGFDRHGPQGSFPIVCWTRSGDITWGVEALDLTAGSCVAWLCDLLGITPADTQELAEQCPDSDGVFFMPALEGLGAPQWDFGARAGFVGLTRGTQRPHLVRAVLEGVAYRGAELVRTAQADSDIALGSLRVDGGMSQNQVFTQALANALQFPVEVASQSESTLLGASYLAGLAIGTWSSWQDISQLWRPGRIVEPQQAPDHDFWQAAVAGCGRWEEGLSDISFW